MPVSEFLIHLKGRGDQADHSTPVAGDIQDVRPQGYAWSAREAFASWSLAGRAAEDWPASFGVVKINAAQPSRFIEQDRRIYMVPGHRILTVEEKQNLRQQFEAGQITREEVEQARASKGPTVGVFDLAQNRIATVSMAGRFLIKTDADKVADVEEIRFADDFDGRELDFDFEKEMVRSRRYRIAVDAGEIAQLTAGDVLTLPSSRIQDKRGV